MKFKYRNNTLFSVLVLSLLIFSLFNSFSLRTDASVLTKKQKSYDIAIAFDNSGSMYADQSWCRAKYAMEIFASMLDYENGDKLRIYPMWAVTTDGTTSVQSSGKAQESTEPIIINSKNDIDKISNLYTISASGTPFTPVNKAYEYLKSSVATEKWLIVLTDGLFDGAEGNADVLRQRLLSMSKDESIKVQYLGFASAKSLESDVGNGFYTKKSSNAESLMSDLVDICNSIFQRSILPSEYYDGKTLNIDLSMRRVIVFVQGKGASVDSLTSGEGVSIRALQKSGQRKYSSISVGSYYLTATPPVDDTLYGEVVTFDKCSKGQYILNCPGAEKVQIFYEPNVDIKVSLTDENGNSVDASNDGIEAGEYTISSTIVDGTTGEEVTNHKLMGNDVKFTTKVKTSKDAKPTTYENGAKITFEPDDETEVVVEATYLNGEYTISTRDDPFAFPLPLIVREQSVDFDVQLSQMNTDYKIASYNDWLPIKATLSIDGRMLSEAEFQSTDVSFKTSNGVSLYAEGLPIESAYNLYVGRDENNNVYIPTVGTHDIEIVFSYIDEYGKQHKRNCKVPVNVVCDLSVTAVVEQPQAWYKIRAHKKWKPIKLQMTIDGAPLTEEQLARVQPTLNFDKELQYRCEMSPNDSSYYVYIGSDENGNFVKPSTGKYTMQGTATFVDEYGNVFSDEDTAAFEIQRYSKFWRWLFWVLILIALIILIMMILNHPTLPSSIYFNVKRTCQKVKINGTSIGLSTDLYPGEIKCEAKACTPLKNRGKPTVAFEVKGLKPIGSVNWYEIDGTRFKKVNGRYVNEDGETIEQVKPRVRISDDTELKWNTNRHTVTGRIYINHNE